MKLGSLRLHNRLLMQTETAKKSDLRRMDGNEARMRLDLLEFRLYALEESVNRAVGNLMPKLDALLAGSKERDVSTSDSSSTSASPSTSLIEMAKSGNYEDLLRLLVDMEIDYQRNPECTANGDTALHVASSGGHLLAVVVLLGAGAKVNALGHRLRTPLHCAAAQGHPAVAQRLLIAGAKVDAKDADGATPLGLAAGQGNREIVIHLLQKGAQPNEKVVSTAADNGHWNLVELFLQNRRPFVDVCNKGGDPLIVLAAKANRWRIVQLLLEKGASATKCKADKECALVLASHAGQADAVRQLLINGAASNPEQVKLALLKARNAAVVWAFVNVVPDQVRAKPGGLGLVYAGRSGRLEPMVAFLEAGVDINAIDGNSGTALSYAAWKGHLACVRELLNRGADFNAKNNLGNTPLHGAALEDRVECVRALLDAGASVTERNDEGKTPLEVAASHDVRVLLRYYAR